MNINLTLDVNEVQTILNILLDLPIKTNLHPVAVKIREQAEAQLSKQEEAAE